MIEFLPNSVGDIGREHNFGREQKWILITLHSTNSATKVQNLKWILVASLTLGRPLDFTSRPLPSGTQCP